MAQHFELKKFRDAIKQTKDDMRAAEALQAIAEVEIDLRQMREMLVNRGETDNDIMRDYTEQLRVTYVAATKTRAKLWEVAGESKDPVLRSMTDGRDCEQCIKALNHKYRRASPDELLKHLQARRSRLVSRLNWALEHLYHGNAERLAAEIGDMQEPMLSSHLEHEYQNWANCTQIKDYVRSASLL